MMEVTIKLEGSFDVTSNEQTVTVDMAQVPDAILIKSIYHGLTQKIADSVASAHKDTLCAKFGWENDTEYKAGKDTKEAKDYANSQAYKDAKAAIVKETLEETLKTNIYGGQWAAERKARKASATVDPVRKLARDLATTFLTQSLTAKLGKDMTVWAKNEKLAKLFTFTEKGNARFDLAAVDAWIKSYDKRDFMAEAQELVNAAQQDDGDDLEELGF